jgi:hypothetical protein
MCGIGAVLTVPEHRSAGHASLLIEHVVEESRREGALLSGLFSEIGAAFYQRLGFSTVALDEVTVNVSRRDGSPAMLVRAGDDGKTPIEVHRRSSLGIPGALNGVFGASVRVGPRVAPPRVAPPRQRPRSEPLADVFDEGDRYVVIAELPRTRETLLLRLLGKGRLLREALTDLAKLPDDAWERAIATPLLVHFKLDHNEHATTEEDDVSAEIRAWFDDYQRKLRDEASQEGRMEGERRSLLRLLRTRFGELPAAAIARVEAAELAELERWGERMFSAATLAEVLDEPS